MFGIGGVELAIILVFAFLLFGPDKLPQIIRTVTQILNQLKGLRDQANQVIKTEVVDPLKDIEQSVSPLTNNATAVTDKLAQKLGIASNTISETLKPVGNELKAAATTTAAAAKTAATTAATAEDAEKGTIPTEKKPSQAPIASASASTPTPATTAAVDVEPQESFAQRKARLEREHASTGLANQGSSSKPASPSLPENNGQED